MKVSISPSRFLVFTPDLGAKAGFGRPLFQSPHRDSWSSRHGTMPSGYGEPRFQSPHRDSWSSREPGMASIKFFAVVSISPSRFLVFTLHPPPATGGWSRVSISPSRFLVFTLDGGNWGVVRRDSFNLPIEILGLHAGCPAEFIYLFYIVSISPSRFLVFTPNLGWFALVHPAGFQSPHRDSWSSRGSMDDRKRQAVCFNLPIEILGLHAASLPLAKDFPTGYPQPTQNQPSSTTQRPAPL